MINLVEGRSVAAMACIRGGPAVNTSQEMKGGLGLPAPSVQQRSVISEGRAVERGPLSFQRFSSDGRESCLADLPLVCASRLEAFSAVSL